MDTRLSELIAQLRERRAEKKRKEFELKQVDAQIGTLEMALMEQMDNLGITQSKSAIGSVTIGESVVPQVENWDAVYAYMRDADNFDIMLQRRMSVMAYRELLSQGKNVPGVVPYTKRKITFKEA